MLVRSLHCIGSLEMICTLCVLSPRRPSSPADLPAAVGKCSLSGIEPARDNDLDMALGTRARFVNPTLWRRRVLNRRRPRSSLRLSGASLLRFADRQFLASLFHLPPRMTRLEPETVITPKPETRQKPAGAQRAYRHAPYGLSGLRRYVLTSLRRSYHIGTAIRIF